MNTKEHHLIRKLFSKIGYSEDGCNIDKIYTYHFDNDFLTFNVQLNSKISMCLSYYKNFLDLLTSIQRFTLKIQ
jgi:hypothetical protein